MRARPFAAALLLALAAGAPEAMAQLPGRTAILAVEIRGDAAPELREQVHLRLVSGLAAAGAEVIPLDEVRPSLAETPELEGCVSTDCLEQIQEILGADQFARARVEASGADYQVAVELLSADAEGGLVHRIERRCIVCTITEFLDEVEGAGASLFQPPKRGPVLLDTDPPGALVTIGGEEVGTSPKTVELPAGLHEVVASLPGRLTARETIRIAGTGKVGAPEEFRLSLPPSPEAHATKETETSPFRRWKWAAAGGSLAALVAGTVLVGVDDGQRCDRGGESRQCPSLYRTRSAGLVSLVAGVGLGGLSGWMFWDDHQRGLEARAALTPTSGGAAGSVTVRF